MSVRELRWDMEKQCCIAYITGVIVGKELVSNICTLLTLARAGICIHTCKIGSTRYKEWRMYIRLEGIKTFVQYKGYIQQQKANPSNV
jgi:hypothetical protein